MANTPSFHISSSRLLVGWLSENQISLAFTTYQAGRLFFLGVNPQGGLSAFERAFARCMGLWSDGQTMWLSSLYQVWRLENTLADGEITENYDRLYVPQVGFVTGDIDVHDIAIDSDQRPVFVNTLFSCLATVDERYSFQPLWRPPFVSRLAPEDRCHLNGLAMREGQPRYVTACSQSDVVEGWRTQRVGSGCVVDVASNEVVCEGLTMPHSPRWHEGKLWLLDSGTGFLGYLDPEQGQFEQVVFCPGYARGLAFVGDYAVVGISQCREERTFSGLPLQDNLDQRKGAASCGLLVIDWKRGDIVHWVRIEGVVQELYDVAILPGVKRPKALGFKTDEIRRIAWLEENGQPERWRANSVTEK